MKVTTLVRVKAVTFCFFALAFKSYSQDTSAGINVDNPNPNAVLHLVSPSNNQGLLIPSLTTNQRNGMVTSLGASVDNVGIVVYDQEEQAFYFWNGAWVRVANTNETVLANILTANSNAGGNQINDLGEPTNAQDAATKNYVDNRNLVNALAAGNSAGNTTITDLPEPTNPQDVATKNYVDSQGDSDNQDLASVLGFGNNAGNTIEGVLDPLNPQDAATKNYVDNLITASDATLVGNGTTGVPLGVNTGTGANQIVQLDGAGALPALDGSALTGIAASSIAANSVTSIELANGAVTNTELAADAVNSSNIVDGTITDVDIADVSVAKVIGLGSAALEEVGIGANQIVQLDGTGALPALDGSNLTGVAATIAANSINSGSIADASIVDADVNAAAAIAGTKIDPDFGTQNISTLGTVNGRDVGTDGTNQDDLQILSGVAVGGTDLGTFLGSTITPNADIVTAFQDLETAVEGVGTPAASAVTNAAAGNIAATDVQGAINELDAEKLALTGGTLSGDLDLGANNILSAGSIDGRDVGVDGTDQDDLQTLSGLAAGTTTLGTFTGATITDNIAIKPALQELETAVESVGTPAASAVTNAAAGNIAATDVQGAINELDAEKLALTGGTLSGDLDLGANNILSAGSIDGRDVGVDGTDQDDLQTLSGLAAGTTTLGTFTGATITDNIAIKPALQELETAVESAGTPAASAVTNVAAGNIAATDVQGAINELDAEKLALTGGALSGDLDLGANNILSAGSIDGRDVGVDGTDQDDLQTLSGLAAGTTTLGIFTGATITDNIAIKPALQELETAVESVGTPTASAVTNAAAGNIAATDVQGAINELDAEKLALTGGTLSGDLDLGANNILSAGSIDGRDVGVDGTDQDDLQTLSGLAAGTTTLGTFTGATITDNIAIKPALQELETAVESVGTPAASAVTNAAAGNIAATDVQGAINELDAEKLALTGGTLSGDLDLGANNILSAGSIDGRDVGVDGTDQDDLQTLSGLAAGTTTLGTFTGATITDNIAIKPALQELETAVESAGTPAASAVTNVAAGNIAATDVQGAINELDAEKLALTGGTLSGDLDLGANNILSAGSIDGRDVGVDGTDQDDLQTLSGLAAGTTTLGTFTGATITDNIAIKPALQELETAVESATSLDLQTAYQNGGSISTDAGNGPFSISGTESITLDATGAGGFSVDGGDLDLVTTSAGDINISPAGQISLASSGISTNVAGTLDVAEQANLNSGVNLGLSTTDAINVNGDLSVFGDVLGANPLTFQGATDNANVTTFSITDPTVANTITFPDASGTVLLAGGLANNLALSSDGTGQIVTADDGQPFTVNSNTINLGNGPGDQVVVAGSFNATSNNTGNLFTVTNTNTGAGNAAFFSANGSTAAIQVTHGDASQAGIISNNGLVIGNLTSDPAGAIRYTGTSFEGNTDGTPGGWVDFATTDFPLSASQAETVPLLDLDNTDVGPGRAATFTSNGTQPVLQLNHGTLGQAGLESNTGIIIGNLPVDQAGAIRYTGTSFEGNTDGSISGWVDFATTDFPLSALQTETVPLLDLNNTDTGIGSAALFTANGTGPAVQVNHGSTAQPGISSSNGIVVGNLTSDLMGAIRFTGTSFEGNTDGSISGWVNFATTDFPLSASQAETVPLLDLDNTDVGLGRAATFTSNGTQSVLQLNHGTLGQAGLESNTGIIIGNLPVDQAGAIRYTGTSFEGNTDGSISGWVDFATTDFPLSALQAETVPLLDLNNTDTGLGSAALFSANGTVPAIQVNHSSAAQPGISSNNGIVVGNLTSDLMGAIRFTGTSFEGNTDGSISGWVDFATTDFPLSALQAETVPLLDLNNTDTGLGSAALFSANGTVPAIQVNHSSAAQPGISSNNGIVVGNLTSDLMGAIRFTGTSFEGNTDGSISGWVDFATTDFPLSALQAETVPLLDLNNTDTGLGSAALFSANGTVPAIQVNHSSATQPGISSNNGVVIGNLTSDLAGAIRFDGVTFEGNTDGTPGGWADFTAPSFQMGISEDPNTVAFGSTAVIDDAPGNSLQVVDEGGAGGATLAAATFDDDLVGNVSSLALVGSRGVFGAPTAIQTGDVIGEINFLGFDGTSLATGLATGAGIRVNASDIWSLTNNGASMSFATTANATTTSVERLRIRNNGNVTVTGGDFVVEGDGINARSIIFTEGDATTGEVLGFKAPDDILNTPVIWTLPDGDGLIGQALTTDGSGTLDWSNLDPFSSSFTDDGDNLIFGSTVGAIFPSTSPNYQIGAVAPTGQAVVSASSFGGTSEFRMTRANGTESVPAQVSNGDTMGEITFVGREGGGSYLPGVTIRAEALEDWVGTGNVGTALSFQTTTAGTGTQQEIMRLENDAVLVEGDLEFNFGIDRDISISDNTSGSGDNLDITAGTSTGGAGAGGTLNLNAGDGNGAGAAGDVVLRPGTGSAVGTVRIAGDNTNPSALILENEDNSGSVGFQATTTGTSNVVYTLPDGDGAFGQALTTDGVGNLDWVSSVLTLPYSDAGSSSSSLFTLDNDLGPAATFINSFDNAAVEVQGNLEFLEGSTRDIEVIQSTTGAGDGLNISAGTAAGGGFDGGGLSLSAGNASGAGTGGDVSLNPGNGSLNGRVVANGDLAIAGTGGVANALVLQDQDASQFLGFKAPDDVTATSVVWTLPNGDGTATQVLSTDGGGNLDWTNAGITLPFSDTDTGTGTSFDITNTGGGLAASFSATSGAAVELDGSMTFLSGNDGNLGVEDNTGGDGNALNLFAGSTSAASSFGGGVNINAGQGNGNANGNVNLVAGFNGSDADGRILMQGVTRFSSQNPSQAGTIQLGNNIDQFAIGIAADPGMTANYDIVLPANQGTGALTNDGGGNLTWSSSPFAAPTFDDPDNVVFGALSPAIPTTGPDTQLGVVVDGGAGQATLSASSYDNRSQMVLLRAAGALGGEAALAVDEVIGDYGFVGHDGVGYNLTGSIMATTTEAWSPGFNGTALSFAATYNGNTTASEMMRLEEGRLSVTNANGQAAMEVASYNAGLPSQLNILTSNGTIGAPAALNLGDEIGQMLFVGNFGGANNFTEGARINSTTVENWGSGLTGSQMRLGTTPVGTSGIVDQVLIDHDGNVNMLATGALQVHSGTTPERPGGAVPGMIRYNSTLVQFEGFNGGWEPLGSVINSDNFDDGDNLFFGSASAGTIVGTAPNYQMGAVAEAGRAVLSASSYGNSSEMRIFRANGSPGGETQINVGEAIGEIAYVGYEGTGSTPVGAIIRAEATENWTASFNVGAALSFRATPSGTGSPIEMMRLEDNILGIDGDIELFSGTARAISIEDNGGGAGDNLNISSGSSGTTADGGTLSLSAGTAGAGFTSGSVEITPGYTVGSTPGTVQVDGHTRFGHQDVTVPGSIELEDAGGANAVSISADASSAAYGVILPAAQGTGALTNDGGGNLVWATAGLSLPFSDTDATTPGGSASFNISNTNTGAAARFDAASGPAIELIGDIDLFAGGPRTIGVGPNPGGNGDILNITAGSTSFAGADGGALDLRSGDGNGAGNGGDINLIPGSGTLGGRVTLQSAVNVTGNINVGGGNLILQSTGGIQATGAVDADASSVTAGFYQVSGTTVIDASNEFRPTSINLNAGNFSVSSTGDMDVAGNTVLTGNLVSTPTGSFTGGAPLPSNSRVITVNAGGTINEIVAGVDGQEIIIVTGAGGITITHFVGGADNVRLNAGANFTTVQAGSTLHLIYSNGFWVEISRSLQP